MLGCAIRGVKHQNQSYPFERCVDVKGFSRSRPSLAIAALVNPPRRKMPRVQTTAREGGR
jgi:hypothetical protein